VTPGADKQRGRTAFGEKRTASRKSSLTGRNIKGSDLLQRAWQRGSQRRGWKAEEVHEEGRIQGRKSGAGLRGDAGLLLNQICLLEVEEMTYVSSRFEETDETGTSNKGSAGELSMALGEHQKKTNWKPLNDEKTKKGDQGPWRKETVDDGGSARDRNALEERKKKGGVERTKSAVESV